MLDSLKDNEAVAWAVNKFLKISFFTLLVYGSLLIANKILGFTFEFSANLGI